MKRLIYVMLVIVMLLIVVGCNKKEETVVNNDVFTDEFFSDVVEIEGFPYSEESVTGNQMDPVIAFFKSLTLKDTDIHLSNTNEEGEDLYGLFSFTFVKSDGTEITVLTNDQVISDIDGKSYEISSENFHDGLVQAFTDGLSVER